MTHKINFTGVWQRIFASWFPCAEKQDLATWRECVFSGVFILGIVVGLISYVSSVQLALSSGNWLMIAVYTAAYALALAVALQRRIPFHYRAGPGMLLVYMFGLARLIETGSMGSGRIWFFAFVVLTAIFLGLRASIAAWLLNTVTLEIMSQLQARGLLNWQQLAYSTELWNVSTITFLFLSAIVGISVAVLVRSMGQAMIRQGELIERLSQEVAERKRAEALLAERDQLLSAFAHIGHAVLSSLDLQDLLKQLGWQLVQEQFFRSLMVALVQERDQCVSVVRNIVRCADDQIIDDPPGVGPVGICRSFDDPDWLVDTVRSGKLQVIEGWCDRFDPTLMPIEAFDDKVSYFIPVKKGDSVLAVLATGSTRAEKEHILRRIAAMTPLLEQVAIAIEHARLFEAIRRSEAAAREAELRLRLIFDYAFDGISIHREMPDGQRFLVDCNHRYVDMSGRSKAELLEIRDTRLVQRPLGDPVQARSRYNQAIRSGQSCYDRFTWLRPDGRKNIIEYNSAPIPSGSDILLIGIDRDVTDQEQLEQEKQEMSDRLARAQRMESLGILAGGVAHDLNNLLGPLVAYPDLILADLPPHSPLRQDMLQIKQAAERSAAVVQDLLTLARRGAYQMSPLSLNEVIRDYVESLHWAELKARNPHVVCEMALCPDLPPINGSLAHLTKVLLNLVTNAFEAMPHGGSLHIETTSVSLDQPLYGYETVPPGDYVVLSVCDSGPGIAPDDLGKIFEPFYSRKKMGRSGSGLGLAVVYGVVHDHHGLIDLRTRLGQGSEFVLYLPVTTEPVVVVSDSLNDFRGSESVLVVDDLQTQREVAGRLLAALGYRVTMAENGRAAIHHLREHAVDLVVLDMIMPDPLHPESEFDGLDTWREIVQIHPTQKAIIASGFTETERVQEAQRLGVGGFIKKPYTLKGLGQAVRSVLAGG